MKTILALLMMVLSAAAHGQLMKCTSKDGKIVYANSCPPDTTAQQIGAKSSATVQGGNAPAPAQKSLAEREADFKKRAIEKQESEQQDAKKLAEAKQKRDACESAQGYLKSLESGIRIARTDPKTGERIYMDDAERATETTRTRARVEQNCK